MRKRSIAAAVVAAASIAGAGQALANNDPHRVFLPTDPFTIPTGVCDFPVHVDVPVNKEYAKVTTLPDGSTLLKITGALRYVVTNVDTGKSITLNVSGPGRVLLPASGSIVSVDSRGRGMFWVTNGADFGVPNLMYASGPVTYETDFSNDTMTALDRAPSHAVDLCAVLS
jgi:hypothetical protein